MVTKKSLMMHDDARDAGQEPVAPAIPEEIIAKMTQRYVTAYEKLTGHAL